MSAIFNPPDVNSSQQAVPINAFVVPVPEGAVTFFDSESLTLDSGSSAFRVDVYSPFDLSEGETEYIRAEVESEFVAYARRNADLSKRWRLFAALGTVDLALLGLLLAFVFINGDRSFLVLFWLFSVVLLPGPLAAISVLSTRRKSRWAEHLLNTPFVAAFAGRSGDGSEAINKIWSDLAKPGSRRDLASLEESCRAARWRPGVRFYRRLRQGGKGTPGSQSLPRRFIGILTAKSESLPASYFPCRTS